MAELADALRSGRSGLTPVKVQVLSLVPVTRKESPGKTEILFFCLRARVAELADARDLGSRSERSAGSIPASRTMLIISNL